MKQIALLIETSTAYGRGLLRGVLAYIAEHRPWSLHLVEYDCGDQPSRWLRGWRGDGIIARIEIPAIANVLRQFEVPIVDVSAGRLIPRLPWCETDDVAIAQVAFEHLRERGLKRFAFCGDRRFNWSKWRAEHFQRAVEAEGGQCLHYEPAGRILQDHIANTKSLARWLRKLPKPIGLMAADDIRGQQVLAACRRLGIAVPDEVAVIGVDNDELLCELSHPPLTSIIPDTHRTGYQAAALLDTLMSGQPSRAETFLFPPLGIATRQSTDVVAVEDRPVAMAMRFIRNHACEGINVKDVLRAVPQSRRRLETLFQRLFGHTPHEEILRVQLARAKQLLLQSDLPLPDIAERAGFKNDEYFSVVFRKHTGVPPGRYRARHKV